MFPFRLLSISVFLPLAYSWSTFVVPHTENADDSPALVAALNNASYTTDATILFSEGVNYNIWTPINFPELTNVVIQLEGNLSIPNNITAVQAAVNSSSYKGFWFHFSSGTNVSFLGSPSPWAGWIDWYGQQWWTAAQQTSRPHAIGFSGIAGGELAYLKLLKPIAWCFGTSGSSNVHVHDVIIDARSNDTVHSFAFNTDGFDVGGTDMTFTHNYVVNGDDCYTIESGASNISISESYCEGGHGLSIGSLGSGGSVASVANVVFDSVVMNNSLYGARFKSWTGGNGLARDITWKNIFLETVRMPIYVTQNYYDQESGKPNTTGKVNNTHIQDFTFENFIGTINDDPNYFEGSCVTDPCWYYVANATGREVVIFDTYPNTTSNLLAKDLLTTTIDSRQVAVLCNETAVSGDVGFKCWDGPYIPDAAGF